MTTPLGPPFKVAIVGLGYFSQFHQQSWRAIQKTDIVAVCDTDSERASAVAADLGVSAYSDLDALLTAHDPDIVDIVAPPPAHRPLIERAARPGRLIICQKPFCGTVENAAATAQLASDAGATVIVHENFRFQPWHRQIKDQITDGHLGRIYQARFTLRPGDGRGADAYLARQPGFQKMPRFLIFETAIHLIDLFGWLFGDIQAVYADIARLNPVIAGEDTGTLLFDHAGGARTLFDGNRLSDHISDNQRRTMGEFVIEGEGGTLRLDGYGHLFWRRFGSLEEQPIPVTYPIDDAVFGGGCVEALNRHAVDALEGRHPFANTAEAYVDIMRIVDAAYTSADEQSKVQINARKV